MGNWPFKDRIANRLCFFPVCQSHQADKVQVAVFKIKLRRLKPRAYRFILANNGINGDGKRPPRLVPGVGLTITDGGIKCPSISTN